MSEAENKEKKATGAKKTAASKKAASAKKAAPKEPTKKAAKAAPKKQAEGTKEAPAGKGADKVAPASKMTVSEISGSLKEAGYVPTRQIAFAASAAVNNNVPLLLEGDAGVGKTYLAKSVAEMLGLPLVRVQFYEGLTADQLLFDYDYQKQLLTIQAISSALEDTMSGKDVDDAIKAAAQMDFYSEDFLIERPLLRAVNGGRCVLLLDEVDKSSEEIEYALLEFLEDYSISVPQLGTMRCADDAKPIVFLTSNRYRELSDALKRRCAYLYIPQKTKDEIYEILLSNARGSKEVLEEVAAVLHELSNAPLKKPPSIAEGIEWANILEESAFDEDLEVADTVPVLLKSASDAEWLKSHSSKLDRLVKAWSAYKAQEYDLGD